jgi:hypothetical protein
MGLPERDLANRIVASRERAKMAGLCGAIEHRILMSHGLQNRNRACRQRE